MTEEGIVERALSGLGKGFDITNDFRLKYCKGNDRLIWLNESENRELNVPGFGAFPNVSSDIKCDKGDRTRFQSDILDFSQMSEVFNQKCSVQGKIPTGLFNSMFGFGSGSWGVDAANTKSLMMDAHFIALFSLHVDRYPLLLADQVRNAVPSTWDPPALARFIEKYGTHIIVGLSIGGQDAVLVRQDKSSNLQASQVKSHLDQLGDQLFSGSCEFSPHQTRSNKDLKQKGITVICSKRGGDTSSSTHCEWLLTVPTKPDAIHFDFIPITSLLRGVPGKGFLSHAINLYLRYKPPIGDLQYFLDLQAHKLWAPAHNDLPLGPTANKALRNPTLHFSLMAPKLYVNTTQVIVGKRPVTGMRLYLEGIKCNRLGVHLQHLSNATVLLQDRMSEAFAWRSSQQVGDDRYLEAVQGKRFSHISTAPVKYDPSWCTKSTQQAFIVTGAQIHVTKHPKSTIPAAVLHLRLLYSTVSSSYVVQSNWMHCPNSDSSTKSSIFSAISMSISGALDKDKMPMVIVDSGVYPTGPPVPVQSQKLLKFLDTSELCRGPQDNPGHWLVTGAKLDLDKGKIRLNVKFSLLNICS